jgi:hypothetical protein
MSAHAYPSVRQFRRWRVLTVVVAAAMAAICGFVVVWGLDLFRARRTLARICSVS